MRNSPRRRRLAELQLGACNLIAGIENRAFVARSSLALLAPPASASASASTQTSASASAPASASLTTNATLVGAANWLLMRLPLLSRRRVALTASQKSAGRL